MAIDFTSHPDKPPAEQRRQLSEISRQLFAGTPLVRRLLQRYRPFICPFDRLLDHVRPGNRVLDVGCGSGLFLGLLVALGKQIRGTGIDPSSAAIESARAMATQLKNIRADSSLEFTCIAPDQPWPAEQFDVVSLIDVMHHIPPPEQRRFLAAAAGAVAPSGLLIYKDMCRRPYWRALANRAHDLLVAKQWIHYLPVETVEKWGGDLGLKLEHAERIDLLWYGHELRIFRKISGA